MSATFSLSALLKVVPKWVDSFGATDVYDSVTATHSLALTDGSGSGNASAYWRDQITIPAGQMVALDLRSLTSKAFGGTGTIGLSTVKAVMVVNNSTDSPVAFGVVVANHWGEYSEGGISVAPGGVLYSTNAGAGWQTAANSKAIGIENYGSGSAAIDVYLVGVLL
jgi:hypothetical protein